ncbi:MAG: TonB family protein [Alsobacter sp.]
MLLRWIIALVLALALHAGALAWLMLRHTDPSRSDVEPLSIAMESVPVEEVGAAQTADVPVQPEAREVTTPQSVPPETVATLPADAMTEAVEATPPPTAPPPLPPAAKTEEVATATQDIASSVAPDIAQEVKAVDAPVPNKPQASVPLPADVVELMPVQEAVPAPTEVAALPPAEVMPELPAVEPPTMEAAPAPPPPPVAETQAVVEPPPVVPPPTLAKPDPAPPAPVPPASPAPAKKPPPPKPSAAPAPTQPAAKPASQVASVPPAVAPGPSAAAVAAARGAYLAGISAKLLRARSFPAGAPSGTVVVKFAFDRSGALISRGVATSSGSAVLDAAALATIDRAAPFPAAPPEVTERRFQVTIPLVYRAAGR